MTHDMKKTLMRMLTLMLLMMVSIGAWADVKVIYGEKGTELQADKDGTITIGQKEGLTGGTIVITQVAQRDGTTKVTLAVTPSDGYTLAKDGLEVYTVAPADISQTRTVKASTKLDIKSEDFKDEASKRTYIATIDSNLALWLKSANFQPQKRDGAKGTDYSGTYFIANQNSKGTKYNDSSPATNFYLVPAADPQVQNKRDVFYSSDYTASYGDPEKPFLTTALTNLDDNSAWKITKTNGYYTIQHVVTRKYIVYEPPHSDKPNRKSVHLLATDDPGEMGLFDIQQGSGGYTIRPLSVEGGNRYFNPANTNYNDYHGHDGDYNCAGLVGLYSDGGGNSLWHLESAPTDNSYTFHIIDRQGNIAVKKTVDSQQSLAMLKDYNDIPEDIRSPYLAGETVTFYSFDGDYSSDKLNDENIITATPYANNSNIYVTYTLDHLSEKFLRLRGARAFNIVTNDGCAYDNNGTLAYDSEAANKSQSSHLWNISGGDPYAVKIENLGTHWFLVSSSMPTLSLAENATKFILMEESASATAENEQVKLMKATGTEDLVVEKAEFQANPVSITTKYHLIDKAGKLIQGNIECESSELGLPEEWRSPLVSEYHYFKTSGLSGDTYNPSDPIINPFEVGNGGDIYVTYDVSSDIDLTGGKSYLLKFSDGVSFNQENGSDGINTTQTQAVYPYNNGDFNLYVYGQEQWESQLASGASTRTRWLWKFVSRHGGTDLTGDQVDPYHVVVKSHQNHTIKATKGSDTEYKFPGNSYLQTYKPSDYDGVITNIAYENKEYSQYYSGVMPSTMVNGEPTEYMILGTSLQDMKLKTFSQVAGERRIVNSFEQYWKNNPTVANLSSVPTDWHQFTSWAYSAPVGNDNKRLKEENHWYQTISMGTGEFSVEEVSLTPQVILLDQHGWEVVRVPMYTDNDFTEVNTEALHKFNSPMVSEYHWYPSANKVTGYHKYNISNPAPKIDIYENSANPNNNNKVEWHVVRSESYSSNSLAMTPDDNLDGLDGYAGQDKKYKSDFYVTYTVKPEYANSYTGAATANATVASAVRIKQDGKYASTDGSQITPIEAADNQETIPDEMQWYLRPNFNIDREMGYRYAGESGAYEGAKSQSETETENFANGKNGFDPYNIQIQSKKYPQRYFTTNTSAPALANGVWTGNSSSISLQNMTTTSRQTATGYDQTTLLITNATFMVVDDGHGNMRLMPRFDHSKVMQSFTTLADQIATTDASQTLLLGQAPRLIHSSDEMTNLNGRYILASDFTFASNYESLGTSTKPFTGTIDGQMNTFEGLTVPLVAYANGAIIRNIIIKGATISSGNTEGDAGAICCKADGATRIYNCGILPTKVERDPENKNKITGFSGSSVSGPSSSPRYVGGIVGFLDGTSRVINCYSYANITGGSVGAGIVGYNNYASKYNDLKTMVMNCMFYGDINDVDELYPIYGGSEISNDYNANTSNRLNNYNYFLYEAPYSEARNIPAANYNCALAAEERFLVRFEFYRHLLNSTRELAAWYATGDVANGCGEGDNNKMAKWVLDKSIAPYPILKPQGTYPSVINYDTEYTFVPEYDSTTGLETKKLRTAVENSNQGKDLGKTLSVTIQNSTSGGQTAPSGANVETTSLTLPRIDKDTLNYNFNYDKVQLPYYNEVGEGNYTGKRVVTGWKITGFTGGSQGERVKADFTTTENYDAPNYNFADRDTYAKDLYSISGRVFAQGAYFNVPKDVTGITIEPYWAVCTYLSDQNYDGYEYKDGGFLEITSGSTKLLSTRFSNNTDYPISGSGQKVYTSASNAVNNLSGVDSPTVYDYAVVLVGNYHACNASEVSSGDTPFTIMSIDNNHDNEPDYSLIFKSAKNQTCSPIRYDFINVPATSMAHKMASSTDLAIPGNCFPKGWYEVTTTGIIRFGQLEYGAGVTSLSPLILMGGVVEQIVSTNNSGNSRKKRYLLFGDNVWFKMFNNGAHGDQQVSTPHRPISVTGGEYKRFYLTGYFLYDKGERGVETDNAECYIDGGKFGEVAGAGQEQINGDVNWFVNHADIDNFFGGGINESKPILGNITNNLRNSRIGLFCGGPKFGNMNTDKTVITTANNCTFGTYYGAGNGGNAIYLNRRQNQFTSLNYGWRGWITGTYDNSGGDYYRGKYLSGQGIASGYEYEFFAGSSGNVARLYIHNVSLSAAQTNNATSTLTDCTVLNNFYGGGNLGKVKGDIVSLLTNCTVKGNVFGAGQSATVPDVEVFDLGGFATDAVSPNYNQTTGVYEQGQYPSKQLYKWKQVNSISNKAQCLEVDGDNRYIKTTQDLETLGAVDGNVTLTIQTDNGKTTTIGTVGNSDTGNVFGGGEQSSVTGATHTVTVNLKGPGNTNVLGNVFGGGDKGEVQGSAEVNIKNED